MPKAAICLQQEIKDEFDEDDNNKSIKGKLSLPRTVAVDTGDSGLQGCPHMQSHELYFQVLRAHIFGNGVIKSPLTTLWVGVPHCNSLPGTRKLYTEKAKAMGTGFLATAHLCVGPISLLLL